MTRRHPARQRTPRERRIRLCIHSAVFIVVNAGLITLNLIRHPHKLWFYWPLFGWGGLGLFCMRGLCTNTVTKVRAINRRRQVLCDREKCGLVS